MHPEQYRSFSAISASLRQEGIHGHPRLVAGIGPRQGLSASDRLRHGPKDDSVRRFLDQKGAAAQKSKAFAKVGGKTHSAIGGDGDAKSHERPQSASVVSIYTIMPYRGPYVTLCSICRT